MCERYSFIVRIFILMFEGKIHLATICIWFANIVVSVDSKNTYSQYLKQTFYDTSSFTQSLIIGYLNMGTAGNLVGEINSVNVKSGKILHWSINLYVIKMKNEYQQNPKSLPEFAPKKTPLKLRRTISACTCANINLELAYVFAGVTSSGADTFLNLASFGSLQNSSRYTSLLGYC